MEAYSTRKSEQLYMQMKDKLIDGVASSFHKAPIEPYPILFSYGKGSRLYDVDGNEYIDYVLGMGPLILGHSPASVGRAVSEQTLRGSLFSAPTESLLCLSELLTDTIPCADMVAFQNTGTEAVMLALRLARAYTGRNKIIKFEGQYHGWSDEEKWSIDASCAEELGPRRNPYKIPGSAGQNPRAAEDVLILPWNDPEILETCLQKEGDQIAAVITEPIMLDSGPILPKKGYLTTMRKLTEKYGTLLIFDEVITGFRVAFGGAQAYYGVCPDLAVFAKAIGGGYPISAVAGRRDIMQSGVHPSGTFNANPIVVTAALATLKELGKPGVYARFEELGDWLTKGVTDAAERWDVPVSAAHIGAVCMFVFGTRPDTPPRDFREFLSGADTDLYDQIYLRMLRYGIRITYRRGRWYLSTAHTYKDIERTLETVEQVFYELCHNE